jgi:hypothetical protein
VSRAARRLSVSVSARAGMPGLVVHTAAIAMIRCCMRPRRLRTDAVDLQGAEISVEGHVDRSEAEIVSGAYVVAVMTVLERQGLLLALSYLTDLARRAAAAHLWSARQAPRLTT